MHNFELNKQLKKKIEKLKLKEPIMYSSLLKKIKQIVSSSDIHHYKNLKSPLQRFKRVHINRSFVLIFEYIEKEDLIKFEDFNHHDIIYRN